MSPRKARTLLRHARAARLLHLAGAVAILLLIASGLAVSGELPPGLVVLLGGHTAAGDLHRMAGIVFAALLLASLVLVPSAFSGFLASTLRFERRELFWLLAFPRFALRPDGRSVPWHAGRFDPGQRVVFLALALSLAVCTASGVALLAIPPGAVRFLAVAIRVHVASGFVLIFATALHIAVGTGLLPVHRGVSRVMFGDGRIPIGLARRLWPAWAEREERRQETPRPGHAGEARPPTP